MRKVNLATAVCLLMGASAIAAPPDPQLMAPIRKFIDGFNKGDMAAAASTHAADPTIIDEVSPYLWRGPKAFATWGADLEKDSKARGVTDESVTISAPIRTETSGDSAYVMVSAVYNFKEKGVAMRETAHMTFVLKKGAAGWLILGWTWTGPKPEAVKAAKPTKPTKP